MQCYRVFGFLWLMLSSNSEWCRGGEGRFGYVVLPVLPVTKGSPVRDERAPRLLLVPAPTDKEAVGPNHS